MSVVQSCIKHLQLRKEIGEAVLGTTPEPITFAEHPPFRGFRTRVELSLKGSFSPRLAAQRSGVRLWFAVLQADDQRQHQRQRQQLQRIQLPISVLVSVSLQISFQIVVCLSLPLRLWVQEVQVQPCPSVSSAGAAWAG